MERDTLRAKKDHSVKVCLTQHEYEVLRSLAHKVERSIGGTARLIIMTRLDEFSMGRTAVLQDEIDAGILNV